MAKKNKTHQSAKSAENNTSPLSPSAPVPLDSRLGIFLERVVLFRSMPAILVGLFFLNGLYTAWRNSASCDELGAHIQSGYLYWSTGQFSGGVNNPPLGQLIIGFLVKLFGLEYTLFSEQHLFLFRLPVLLLGVVLAIFLYKWTASLLDKKTAVLALFFYCFSPNILAHASLATLDIPIACFVFLTLYFAYRFLHTGSLRAYIPCCLFLAAALTTKIQAILLLPILLLLFIAYFQQWATVPQSAQPKSKNKKRGWDLKKLGIVVLLLAIILVVVINLVYLNFPFGEGKNILPREFIASIQDKFQHSEAGHFSYLLGQYSDQGWWYYFPLIILFKTPLVVLVLLTLGLLAKPTKKTVFFMFIPIVVFLVAAMGSHINIGIRHILIIYPFLFMLAALGAIRLWRLNIKKKALLPLVLVLLLGWHMVDAVFITPHQLSYFNILAGGSQNGHKIMVDSNYDWGLNDYDLAAYVQEKNIPYKINPDPFVPQAGHILVNVNALYGILNEGPEAYQWLKEYTPIQQICYTWFEYNVPETDLPKLAPFAKPEKHHYNYPDHLNTDVALFQQQYATDTNPEPHLKLALMFLDRWDYPNAFKEIRFVLKHDPTNKYALSLGGEMIVRFKLGVLLFKDDDYLTFFKENAGQ